MTIRPIYIDADALPANGTALQLKTGATGEIEASSGGGDAIKLDDLAAPDDNTDLDATTGAHGLMSKSDKTKLDGIEAAADVTDATNVGAAIHGAAEKVTPVNADKLALIDTEAGNVLKWLSWTNVKATLKTYFDTLYAAITHTHAQSDITNLVSDLSGKAATSRKLDDFGAPDDNTDLNATTSAHGLLPKLGGGTTNFLRADGTWAAPAGGGSSISTPKVFYVQTTGNNGTAAVGNPSLPYATAQAAYDAGLATAAAFTLRLGVGSHGGISLAADMPTDRYISIVGEGMRVSYLGGITSNGYLVQLHSDLSCYLGDIIGDGAVGTTGDAGAVGGTPGDAGATGGYGGTGGNGALVKLIRCAFGSLHISGGNGGAGGVGGDGAAGAAGDEYTQGGNGGTGGTGGEGGTGGNAGAFSLLDCLQLSGDILNGPGFAGAGGMGGIGGMGGFDGGFGPGFSGGLGSSGSLGTNGSHTTTSYDRGSRLRAIDFMFGGGNLELAATLYISASAVTLTNIGSVVVTDFMPY